MLTTTPICSQARLRIYVFLLLPLFVTAPSTQGQAAPPTLPEALHGFKLGITVDQARAIATKLAYSCKWKRDRWQTEKVPCMEVSLNDYPLRPAVNIPSSTLLVESPEGFQIHLIFINGSLTFISSELDKLNARDAAEFDGNIVREIGKPAVKYMVSDRQDTWRSIWIGKVRLAYQNKPDPTSHDAGMHRMVSVELVSYPQWLELIEHAIRQDPTVAYGQDSAEEILFGTREAWGDARLEEPRVPRELAGLLLGEALSRLTTAHGDSPNKPRDVGNAHDLSIPIADHDAVIGARNGKVKEICQTIQIPGQELESYRNNLPTEYGNPRSAQRNQKGQVVSLSWWNKYEGLAMTIGFLSSADASSPFSHLLPPTTYLADTAQPPDRVMVQTCIDDMRLAVKPFIDGTPDPLVPFRRNPQKRAFF